VDDSGGKTFKEFAAVKAGPHIDSNGKRHPPVGSYNEMLHRGMFGNQPEPWGVKAQERFIVTLQASPLFRKAVREVLRAK
jgi:hypothetical protein